MRVMSALISDECISALKLEGTRGVHQAEAKLIANRRRRKTQVERAWSSPFAEDAHRIDREDIDTIPGSERMTVQWPGI